MSGAETFDPFAGPEPAYYRDPHGALARLRAQHPVSFSEGLGQWVVTGYDAVQAGLREPRLSAERSHTYAAGLSATRQAALAPVSAHLARWSLMADPPRHGRLRGLIKAAFTGRRVQRLRPAVQAVCARLLDGLSGAATFDLLHDFAYPLPVRVIADMLGVPEVDAQTLARWSAAMVRYIGATPVTPAIADAAIAATAGFEAYFERQIEARQREPGDDIISAVLAARRAGHDTDAQDVLSTLTLVLFAGHITTTHVITTGALLLFERPGLLDWLRADIDGRIGQTVEEILRYEGPAMRQTRVVTADVELAGRLLRAGDRVSLMLGAASRDPAHVDRPDTFDPTRPPRRHIAFGHGRHHCVGAMLARLEGQVALSMLLRRLPDLRLAPGFEPRWLPIVSLRGLHGLPVIGGAPRTLGAVGRPTSGAGAPTNERTHARSTRDR